MRLLHSRRGAPSSARPFAAVTLIAVALSALSLSAVSVARASGSHESVYRASLRSATLPHLKLKRASPSPDTTITAAPEAVRLWFSETADLVATRITVKASNGIAVALRKPVQLPGRDAPIMAAFATPPSPGRYTVNWKTMSKDGHVVSGQYDFTITASR